MPAFDYTALEFQLPMHLEGWVKDCTNLVRERLNEEQCASVREIFKLAAQQNAQHVVITWNDANQTPAYGQAEFGSTETPLSYRLNATMREALSILQENILAKGSVTSNFPVAAFGVLSHVIISVGSGKSPSGLRNIALYITPSNLKFLRAAL